MVTMYSRYSYGKSPHDKTMSTPAHTLRTSDVYRTSLTTSLTTSAFMGRTLGSNSLPVNASTSPAHAVASA
jgi:hypothetical protein